MSPACSSNGFQPSARRSEYDLARIVSISLVVLIHVVAPYVAPEAQRLGHPGLINLLSRELRFAVPMFVMLTGALLWSRPFGGALSWRGFFTRRFKVVLAPYVVWSALYVSVGLRLGIKQIPSFNQVVRDIVLGTTWYHLYFVPVIIGVYLFTPVARVLARRGMHWLLLAATACGMVVPIEIRHLDLKPPLVGALIALVATFLPYAAAGAWYASADGVSLRLVRQGWPALLLGGLLLRGWYTLSADVSSYPYLDSALTIAMNVLPSLGLLGLALFVLGWRPLLGPAAAPWAACVFGVYLSHPLVLLAIDRIMKVLDRGQAPFILWVAVVWPAVTLGGFVVVRSFSRYPRLWWLHGVAIGSRVRRHDSRDGEAASESSVR